MKSRARRRGVGPMSDRIVAAVRTAQAQGAPATYADVFRFVISSYADSDRNAVGFREVKRGIDALVDAGAILRAFPGRRAFHLSLPLEAA